MPDTSAVAALARDYGAQFAAGFLTTAITIAAIYTAFQSPVRPAATNHPDVIKRLSFAGATQGHLPSLPTNTTVIARSQLQPVATDDRLIHGPNASPLLQAAASELAGRFAGLTPAVSPRSVIPALIAEPTKSAAASEPDPEEVAAPRKAAHAIADTVRSMDRVLPNIEFVPASQPARKTVTTQTSTGHAPPSVRLNLTRSRTATTRVAFPLDLNPSWSEKRDAGILIGGLPEGVTLSAGRRTALGLWKLLIADARTTQIVVDPTAPAQFELTVLLLDPDGLVVNGIDIMVEMRDPEPGAATKAAYHSTSITPARSSKRRGAVHANAHRHKLADTRQIVHKAKRLQTRPTVTTLLNAEPSPAILNSQRSKIAAQN